MKALWSPWTLHCGLGPESSYGAEMVKVIGFAIAVGRLPDRQGRAVNLLKAFEKLIKDQCGEIVTGADVNEVIIGQGGRANGVVLNRCRSFKANAGRGVASMTPDQIYSRLLKKASVALPYYVKDG